MFDDKFAKIKKETFYLKTLPQQLLKLLELYFRLEVVNKNNVPKKGPVIIAPNHSGFLGLDALILNHIIISRIKRVPRILTHKFWFGTTITQQIAHKMGFFEASMDRGIFFLNRKNPVVIFPEGEDGNFKPSNEMYNLQDFKRGFIRMAVETGAPIVPCLVIGAEESNINLTKLKLGNLFKGLKIPLPMNVIPLPAKWKIIFLDPIYLPYDRTVIEDKDFIREIANDIQELMQERLNEEIKKRRSVFF